MASVTLQGVKKRYGPVDVIHGIDLDIDDGELIVIVGPSGCGKSTLLRMVAGLESITEGQVSIAGQVVNDLEPKERNIAMVFQNYALYPHMRVFDNMAYGLKISGIAKSEIDRRVRRVAEMLELSELLQRRPRELSGGQRQRVAMGRAVVRNPQVFLFDEPLSNLDAKLRVQMRLEIKRLQRELQTTSLYVTHDQVEAMTLADRLVVMNRGVAEQIDTPMAVYAHPATLFVAGFIGSPAMNFLAGRVGDGAGRVVLDGGETLEFAGEGLEAMQGRALMLGLRPEHLRPAEGQPPLLTLRVEYLETLGADTLAYGRYAEGGDLVTVRLSGSTAVREGDSVPLRAAPGALHLFDRDSGLRITDL